MSFIPGAQQIGYPLMLLKRLICILYTPLIYFDIYMYIYTDIYAGSSINARQTLINLLIYAPNDASTLSLASEWCCQARKVLCTCSEVDFTLKLWKKLSREVKEKKYNSIKSLHRLNFLINADLKSRHLHTIDVSVRGKL